MRSKRRKEPAQSLAPSLPRLRTLPRRGDHWSPERPCTIFATAPHLALVGSRSSILGLLPPQHRVPSLPWLRTIFIVGATIGRPKTTHLAQANGRPLVAPTRAFIAIRPIRTQASLREGGGFCEAKDGRSPRKALRHLRLGFVPYPVGSRSSILGLAPAETPCTIRAHGFAPVRAILLQYFSHYPA